MTERPLPPALVLTAGLATRLQPLSSVRAKAALPVAGTPLIVRILHRLRDAGVTQTILNLHHRADTITRIVGDGSAIGISVRYSWETEILGSSGGPARAIPLLAADRFLIVNGDTLADVDLRAMAAQHVDTNALVTMAVVDADPRYNAIVADQAGIVHAFSNRTSGTSGTLGTPGTLGTSGTSSASGTLSAFHFIGIQIVNASVFAGVDPGVKSETVHGIYPSLIASRPGALRIFRTATEFFDIGSPRDYLDTAIAIARREGKPLDRGVDCAIAADARVTDCVIWDRVSVGAGARLCECVVADGVAVAPGSEFSRCSLVMRDNALVVQPFNGATVQQFR
jgi:mannose-1-phosphate guanylyltransferase